MSTKIRVGLVDDQALFRAGIRMLVSSQPDLEFVGEAGNGVEGIAMAAEHRPDVILMDIRMPVMDGIELTHKAAAAHPDLKILLMTGYAEQRERADDLATKIIDVVSKPFSLPDIRTAVARALA